MGNSRIPKMSLLIDLYSNKLLLKKDKLYFFNIIDLFFIKNIFLFKFFESFFVYCFG